MKTRARPTRRTKDVVINVVEARHVGGYKLRLRFSNGKARIVDFGPFLSRSRNPMIRAYLDPKRFASFKVDKGDLLWGDFDLCFPVADLYQNTI